MLTDEEIAALPYRLGVGVMLLNRAGLVFVGQRIDTTAEAWQMPQGGIDDGEEPRDAALRELWEETGVLAADVEIIAETDDWLTYELPAALVPKVWKGRYRGQKQRWYLARLQAGDSAIRIDTAHPEFRAWKWMAPDQLLISIVPFKRDLYAQVLAAFADRLAPR